MSYEIKTPELGTVGLLRWLWRQLTSMRTALILLLLLGVASIPGSIIPQRNPDWLNLKMPCYRSVKAPQSLVSKNQ